MLLQRRAVLVVPADGNSDGALGAPPRVVAELGYGDMEDEQDAAVPRAARKGRDAIGKSRRAGFFETEPSKGKTFQPSRRGRVKKKEEE